MFCCLAWSECLQTARRERIATTTTWRSCGVGVPSSTNRPVPANIYTATQRPKTVTVRAEMPGMMDKGSEYLGKGRSNGTKSPSNASNGHFSDESGSDDEHGSSLEHFLLAPHCRRLQGFYSPINNLRFLFMSSRCGNASWSRLPGKHSRVWSW